MDKTYDYTVEELAAAWERNENFRGHRADMEKVRLYFEIKKDLETLMGSCEDIKAVDGFAPNPKEKHAVLWADLSPFAILEKQDADALGVIIHKADEIILAALENSIRLSFSVNNVWID